MMFTRLVLVICGLTWVVFPAAAQVATWKASAVGGLAFSPDGKWLAACGKVPPKMPLKTISAALAPTDGLLHVWDVRSGQEVFHFKDGEKVPSCLAFSPKGGLLAVGHDRRDLSDLSDKRWPLLVWNIADKKKEMILDSAHTYNSLTFSSDGKLLAAASSSFFVDISPAVTIWEISSGAKKHEWTLDREEFSAVLALSFSPDGKYLALGGRTRDEKSKGRMRVLEVTSGKTAAEFSFQDWVHAVAFSPDGKYLAGGAGGGDATARVYAWPTRQPVFTRKAHSPGTWAVGFGRDAKVLVTAGGLDLDAKNAGGGTWKAWKIPSGELLHTKSAHELTVLRLALSPDGSFLATGSLDEVKLWKMPKLLP